MGSVAAGFGESLPGGAVEVEGVGGAGGYPAGCDDSQSRLPED